MVSLLNYFFDLCSYQCMSKFANIYLLINMHLLDVKCNNNVVIKLNKLNDK